MSDSRSKPFAGRPDKAGRSNADPQAALDALLADAADGNPVRRALWLDALDLRLRPCLPPALAAHARLANVAGGKLVFLVDSPVWHARLRLAADQLIDAARSIGLDARSVVVKTMLQPPLETTAPSKPSRPPSAVAGEALRDAVALLRAGDDGSEQGGN